MDDETRHERLIERINNLGRDFQNTEVGERVGSVERRLGIIESRMDALVERQSKLESLMAEVVEAIGRDERRVVESAIVRALLHHLKVRAWQQVLGVWRGRAEVRGQLDEARDRFSPGMRQHIDMAKLYKRALRMLPEALDDGTPPQSVPRECPWTLDQVLAPNFRLR